MTEPINFHLAYYKVENSMNLESCCYITYIYIYRIHELHTGYMNNKLCPTYKSRVMIGKVEMVRTTHQKPINVV